MNWKPIKAVEYLVIHCAATKASMDIGLEEIRQWHRERGWFDIGYHYVIRRDGTLEYGRPKTRPGAHARGYNHISLGICLVGGVAEDGKTPEDNFTDAQWTTLRKLVSELAEEFPDAEVLGHRNLKNVHKACPSFSVRAWWAANEEIDNGYTIEPGTEGTQPPEEGTVVIGPGSCRFVPDTRPPEKD